MSAPVAIRPLAETDAAEWRRLWRAYLEFYATELPEAVYAATFARNLDPAETDRLGLVAQGQGRLVGLAHVLWHAHNWRLERVCYLQDLYVDEGARGTGTGRALVEAVYAEADRRGTPAVYWLTQDTNATARRLYDRVATVTPFVKYTR